jgi:hypothetical protein
LSFLFLLLKHSFLASEWRVWGAPTGRDQ